MFCIDIYGTIITEFLTLKSNLLLLHIGGLSDRGYNSMSSEDARRIVAAISCTDTAEITPATDCRAEDADSLQGKNRNIRTVNHDNCFSYCQSVVLLLLKSEFTEKQRIPLSILLHVVVLSFYACEL